MIIKQMVMDFSKLTTWGEYLKNSFSPFFLQLFAVLEVIFYTTLPTIILLLFSALDKNLNFKEVIGEKCYINGEFLLYSIALLSSAYTTMKVYRNQNTSFIIILIIVVSISYAIVIKTDEIRVNALLWFSIVAFGAGIWYTWRAMSLKNKEQESFQERDKMASDKLENELNF